MPLPLWKTIRCIRCRTATGSYGVMVSTLDFESSDPSSNLGRTSHNLTPWRNGSASDSRSEGCVFESRRGQNLFNKHARTIEQNACLQWGLNSWPLVYKTNALPLSYRGPCWVALRIRTPRYWSSSQNNLGDTRIWTMDLSDCSRLLYHWAISPTQGMSQPWDA